MWCRDHAQVGLRGRVCIAGSASTCMTRARACVLPAVSVWLHRTRLLSLSLIEGTCMFHMCVQSLFGRAFLARESMAERERGAGKLLQVQGSSLGEWASVNCSSTGQYRARVGGTCVARLCKTVPMQPLQDHTNAAFALRRTQACTQVRT